MSSTTLLASKDHDYKYYELLVNNSIPVLRRSKDGHVNGSQILQLVGLSAQKRRSLLLQFEKNVAKFGCFELVKIGPRRYQGFWLPLEHAVQLARQYNVYDPLRELFETPMEIFHDVTNSSLQEMNNSNTHNHHTNAHQQKNQSSHLLNKSKPHHEFNQKEMMPFLSTVEDKQRRILDQFFEGPENLTSLLMQPNGHVDLDFILDEQGHTALHWAAAMGSEPHIRTLLDAGANISTINYNGETALMRAVRVTDCFAKQSFTMVLEELGTSIEWIDFKDWNVLHHLASVCGMKEFQPAVEYYSKCLEDYLAAHFTTDTIKRMVNSKGKNNQTPMNMALQADDQAMIQFLKRLGSDPILNFDACPISLKQQQVDEITVADNEADAPITGEIVSLIHNYLNHLQQKFMLKLEDQDQRVTSTQSQLEALRKAQDENTQALTPSILRNSHTLRKELLKTQAEVAALRAAMQNKQRLRGERAQKMKSVFADCLGVSCENVEEVVNDLFMTLASPSA